jgi:squalene synthase HpnC
MNTGPKRTKKQGLDRDLTRYGPGRSPTTVSLADARSYCRHLVQGRYSDFAAVALLLPRHLAKHVHHLYAFWRWADHLAAQGGTRSLALLRWWREELQHCYAGPPPGHPVMVALRETVRAFAIPPKPFLDLLFAREQDQLVPQYRSFAQLLGYCRYAANPVGHLVLYLCERFTPERARLADLVSTGLQLVHFWENVRADHDRGRVYLPVEDRRECGYGDADLNAGRYNAAFAAVLRRQVERTRELLYRGLPVVDQLPADSRFEVEWWVQRGQSVLDQIERCGFNVWRRRPGLGPWARVTLMARAVAHRWGT